MDRLTTDKPSTNLMTALNLFYAKDGQAWVRGGGPRPDYPDVTLFDHTRATISKLLKDRTELSSLSDDYVMEIMGAWLLDGTDSIEGLIATLYTAGWAFAELRARLKNYEDIGLLPEHVKEMYDDATAMSKELPKVKAELEAAKRDIAALLWLNGNCEYCKYGRKEEYSGANRWTCTLGTASNCYPEWRGKED